MKAVIENDRISIYDQSVSTITGEETFVDYISFSPRYINPNHLFILLNNLQCVKNGNSSSDFGVVKSGIHIVRER